LFEKLAAPQLGSHVMGYPAHEIAVGAHRRGDAGGGFDNRRRSRAATAAKGSPPSRLRDFLAASVIA
jgi:hypothetical protein